METANNLDKGYERPLGSGAEKLRAFWLKNLGSQY